MEALCIFSYYNLIFPELCVLLNGLQRIVKCVKYVFNRAGIQKKKIITKFITFIAGIK